MIHQPGCQVWSFVSVFGVVNSGRLNPLTPLALTGWGGTATSAPVKRVSVGIKELFDLLWTSSKNIKKTKTFPNMYTMNGCCPVYTAVLHGEKSAAGGWWEDSQLCMFGGGSGGGGGGH